MHLSTRGHEDVSEDPSLWGCPSKEQALKCREQVPHSKAVTVHPSLFIRSFAKVESLGRWNPCVDDLLRNGDCLGISVLLRSRSKPKENQADWLLSRQDQHDGVILFTESMELFFKKITFDLVVLIFCREKEEKLKFHAHDEEIEWDGITLSNPSGRLELISFGSIYKNRYGGGYSINEEVGLSGTSDFSKIRLDSIDNDFDDDLILGGAKSNSPEILESISIRDLGVGRLLRSWRWNDISGRWVILAFRWLISVLKTNSIVKYGTTRMEVDIDGSFSYAEIQNDAKDSAEKRPKPLKVEEEQLLRAFYEFKIQDVCDAFKFPRKIQATALLYFKRFYLQWSVMEHHPKDIMLTCIYAACKAEENHVSAEELGKGIGQDHHVILNNEMLSLGFDLIVYSPYRALEGFISDLEEFCGAKDEDQLVALKVIVMSFRQDKGSLNTARMEADKIMRTDGPLLFPPGQRSDHKCKYGGEGTVSHVGLQQGSISSLYLFTLVLDELTNVEQNSGFFVLCDELLLSNVIGKLLTPTSKDVKHIDRKLKSCLDPGSHDKCVTSNSDLIVIFPSFGFATIYWPNQKMMRFLIATHQFPYMELNIKVDWKTSSTTFASGREKQQSQARGGCNYFDWYDDEMPPQAKRVMWGLLKKVKSFEEERNRSRKFKVICVGAILILAT
ncbi:putative FBD-associated F-box protein-like [Capsicum annuum]|nr:putative FBD-associated F-box protein-like [Capsicum annuum]